MVCLFGAHMKEFTLVWRRKMQFKSQPIEKWVKMYRKRSNKTISRDMARLGFRQRCRSWTYPSIYVRCLLCTFTNQKSVHVRARRHRAKVGILQFRCLLARGLGRLATYGNFLGLSVIPMSTFTRFGNFRKLTTINFVQQKERFSGSTISAACECYQFKYSEW